MAITVSGQVGGKNWLTMSFTATETSVDVVNNTSNVEVTCQLVSTDSSANWGINIDLYLDIDNQQKIGGVDNFSPGWIYGAGVLWSQNLGTYPVQHNGDGTKTVPVHLYIDWGGWGTVDLSGNLPLTNIPREAKFTTTNGDFTIGGTKRLDWTNDGNKWVRLYVEAGGSNLGTYNLGQVTYKDWTPTSSEISTLYTRIGATARTVGVTWIINTYNDSSYSSYLGQSVLYGMITAPLNYSNAIPTFSNSNISIAVTGNSVVKDGDGNSLQSTAWSTLIGNSAVLKGYSSVLGSVTTAATPKYSASMSYYTGTIGGVTNTINAIGDFATFTNATDKVITVKAYDSRGDYKTVTKQLTYINNSYTKPVITSVEIGRVNQVGTTCHLAITGTYYGTGFLSGQNNIGTANALHVKYKYKKATEQNYSAWVDITNDCTISGTSFSYSGNLTTVFSADDFYDFQIVAYDYVDRDFSQRTITNGNPSMHIIKNGISVYGKYNSSAGGHLQVAGHSIDRQPLYYSCHLTADHPSQTIPEASYTPINFTTTLYDPLGMHSNTTNPSRITIPEDGFYYVYGLLRFADSLSVTSRIVRLRINGVDDFCASAGADGSGRYGQSVVASYHFTAGDYIEITGYQTGASSVGIPYVSLGVVLIGLD